MFEMAGRPDSGRVFAGSRRVRLGDCSPGGRLRLDATARYLQDVSDDDTRDAGLAQMTWVVRRTVIDVHRFPVYLEPLELVTWCSGIGSRWAERRVDITSAGGGSISSATLWVHLDAETLRPAVPSPEFGAVFEQSAAGRPVSSRLTLDAPPNDLDLAPWPVRFTDFDVMDHVNNAIAFVLVEEALARHRELRAPLRVEVEYRDAIDRDVALRVGGAAIVDGAAGDGAAVGGETVGGETVGGETVGGETVGGYNGWLVDDQARCPVAFRIARLPSPEKGGPGVAPPRPTPS